MNYWRHRPLRNHYHPPSPFRPQHQSPLSRSEMLTSSSKHASRFSSLYPLNDHSRLGHQYSSMLDPFFRIFFWWEIRFFCRSLFILTMFSPKWVKTEKIYCNQVSMDRLNCGHSRGCRSGKQGLAEGIHRGAFRIHNSHSLLLKDLKCRHSLASRHCSLPYNPIPIHPWSTTTEPS